VHARRGRFLFILTAGICLTALPSNGQSWYLTGQVVMEDGSVPPQRIWIERYCGGTTLVREAVTDRQGRYQMRLMETGGMAPVSLYGASDILFLSSAARCVLRASLSGYQSSIIDLSAWHPTDDPHLRPLILARHRPESDFSAEAGSDVPKTARKPWERAMKATGEKKWAEAERQLRPAVEANPKFAQGWHLLGTLCQNQQKPEEAREAFEHAVEADPKALGPYVLLARLEIHTRDWEAARKTSGKLIQLDVRHRFPEAYVHNAAARYYQRDLDGAERSAREAVRLDKKHMLPRAEYVLGLVLAAKRDYAAAGEHLREYLKLEPKASDAAAVQTRIANLGKPEAAEPAPELDKADLSLPPAGEAWVPGGIRALAAAAHIEKPVSSGDFFAEYCRARVRLASPESSRSLSGYLGSLRTYFAVMAELAQAGTRKADQITIALSLSGTAQRKETERILGLLGWKATVDHGTTTVEPGDLASDGLRQMLPGLVGIDAIAMQEALEAGRSFTIELPSEEARLIGGSAWSGFVRIKQEFPGGLAEAFARDLRLAKTYAGLAEMGTEAATAMVSAVGLRTLVMQHADLLGARAGAFHLVGTAVAVPGGPQAEAVWTKLAGASPRDPQAFFRALFGKDRGRLAAYFAVLSQVDASDQRLFTKTAADATRFYGLFRNPYGVLRPGEKLRGTWPPAYYEDLPLEASGKVRFPGGHAAWTAAAGSDENTLASLGSLDTLIGVARLERERKAPFDARSVGVLSRHWAEWASLRPYFERLPGLGAAEFEALEAFAATARDYPPEKRNLVLGEWHSLVELLALGVRAGSLDERTSADLFRQASEGLRGRDASVQALATLRKMAGATGDLEDGVASRLLRLGGERRAAFERVLQMQRIPRLKVSDDASVLAALTGLVYAAWLDPDGLLVTEDPTLVRKHRFVGGGPQTGVKPLFEAAELQTSSAPEGSHFRGGFANFGAVAQALAGAAGIRDVSAQATSATGPLKPAPGVARSSAVHADFRSDARLVEVPATVTDSRGRYIDNLLRDHFLVLEEGKPQPLAAFESNASGLSCVLLLDTTGSMQAALPALKNAALKLIGELRDEDSVAVYTFNDTVSLLQPFSTDKRAAKRAVLKAYPDGTTALYDALTRVARDIAGRSGKKAIIVFTDGADNTSALAAEIAIRRAKIVGAPVYAVAQGDALRNPGLLKQLQGVALATGGLPYSIHNPAEIRTVFESVANDLKHGYLLAYRPPATGPREWRRIEVQLSAAKSHKVRAREGYYPQ
jgi:VWFA-related protein